MKNCLKSLKNLIGQQNSKFSWCWNREWVEVCEMTWMPVKTSCQTPRWKKDATNPGSCEFSKLDPNLEHEKLHQVFEKLDWVAKSEILFWSYFEFSKLARTVNTTLMIKTRSLTTQCCFVLKQTWKIHKRSKIAKYPWDLYTIDTKYRMAIQIDHSCHNFCGPA